MRKIKYSNAILEAIDESMKKNNSVISLGGGAFLNKEIRKSTKKFCVSFWLDVPIEKLIKRLKKSKKRPLLFKKKIDDTVKKIYLDRKKIYNMTDYKINCGSLKSGEIVSKILNFYEKSGN